MVGVERYVLPMKKLYIRKGEEMHEELSVGIGILSVN